MIEQNKLHFLFSPKNGCCIINGQVEHYPAIGALLRNFIQQDQALVIADRERGQFSYLLTGLMDGTRHRVSDLLLKQSVRLIPSTELPFRLSGGSFAGVDLYMGDDHKWKVYKFINRERRDEDADVRLAREGAFIRDLPAAPKAMFPFVGPSDVIETDRFVGYNMVYCPYPTMAESLLSGHCDGRQIVDAIGNIYEHMFHDMYVHPEPDDEQDDSYFERIDRRFDRIMQTPESVGPRLKMLMRRESLCIDGQRYDGAFPLYERVKQSEEYRRLACPPDHSLCHGDMILEDILLQPYTGEFKLIDPNGRSHSKYYDVAKTLLSLDTFYELFYFDEFQLDADKDMDNVSIGFHQPQTVEVYRDMSERFWAFLRGNAAKFFPGDPDWEKRLVLLNGLQNLAIVMFHLIKHQKEDCAIGFLLMGIRKLSQALDSQHP